MKNILNIAIAFLAITANAEVIKPKNTIEPAVGVVVIENVNLDYRVTDRGWQTSASNDNGKIYMKAVKSFVLSYSTQGEAQTVESSIELSISQDAASKCLELGNIEYVDQSKDYSKMQTSFSAEIVGGKAEKISNNTAFASFVCLVTVEVKN